MAARGPRPAERRGGLKARDRQADSGRGGWRRGSRLFAGILKRAFASGLRLLAELIDRAVDHEAAVAVAAPQEAYGSGVVADLNEDRGTAVSAE